MATEEKTLGLRWNSETDVLSFNTNLSRVKEDVKNAQRIPTKREMLSAVMSLFDPLGLLSSYTITGRILLQQLWREKVLWDENIPEEIAQPFFAWMRNMKEIGRLRLPRCYETQDSMKRDLHIFCDASEDAYAAAAYWRLEQPDNTGKVILISAKAKVAPLKAQTIPKMELQAAMIGIRLAETIKKDHRLEIRKTIYWTDSSTVYQWIQNHEKKYATFVANRLSEIIEHSSPDQWRWIPTGENPADAATRQGHVPTQDGSWFNGPTFMKMPEEEWPNFENKLKMENKEENIFHTEDEKEIIDISRFSKWNKLIRTTARLYLFKDKLLKKKTQLSLEHIEKAKEWWVKKSQEENFKEELKTLKKNEFISKGSPIYRLDPKIQDGILKINGRIGAAPISNEQKEPIILDGRHPYTRLLVQKEHEKAGHANNERVVNDLRQKYWIINLRPTVKTVARNCKLCQVRKAQPRVPLMGNLPAARVEPYRRPFTNTGVDYFGPLTVAIGRRREKRWVALFTCLTTRAVHLEVVSSLSTGSAVMALRRMAARRGWPLVLWSDNASCFKGADAELRAAYEEWLPTLQDVGLQNEMSWRFIPPGAPNQGGAWERLVRSVKVALTSALNEKAPKEEVLITVLAEAEHAVNARPLTHVSVDPKDPEALTPNHFLLGSSTGLPTTGPCEEADRRTWRASQALADEFWRRWVREYLPTLVPRRESASEHVNLKVGDLVVVVDPSLPRNTWPRGVVEAVYAGPDGQVRSADVRTKGGIFKRPSRKLAVLPVAGYDGVCAGGENVTDASLI